VPDNKMIKFSSVKNRQHFPCYTCFYKTKTV